MENYILDGHRPNTSQDRRVVALAKTKVMEAHNALKSIKLRGEKKKENLRIFVANIQMP